MATADPEPLRFLITGIISAWNPQTRLFRIDDHEVWVAPGVSVANVAHGAWDTAVGQEDHAGRRVVTRLTLD
jgi:hypothetical protein